MEISRYESHEFPADDIARLTNNSFFASKGFASLWENKGGQQVFWVAEKQGKIYAVLPGIEFGKGLLRRFVAMPDGCYSRIFFNPTMIVNQAAIAGQILDTLLKQRYVKLFLYDFYHSLPDDPRFTCQECTTTLVDISQPEWLPPDKKLVSQIRRAIREGIEVVPFDWEKHHERFLQLMTHTEHRHGRQSKYSPDFFHTLANLAQQDTRVQWTWCEHNGKPASSHIYFIEGGMLLEWQIYYDKAFSFLKPNQYTTFVICRQLARQGMVNTLNLGASPPDASGLAFYKRQWGGKTVNYFCYVLKNMLGKLL